MSARVLVAIACLAIFPLAAHAQDLSAAERTSALERVRALSACVAQQHTELDRIAQLIREAEQQRTQARDDRVRRDADAAIEALIARAAGVQRQLRACVGTPDLPQPGTTIEEREAPRDPSAAEVESEAGTVRSVEHDARLSEHVLIVRGEQVDGSGSMDAAQVRAAIRAVASRIERCAQSGSGQLDLVFAFRNGAARATNITVEHGASSTLDGCVRQAAAGLRASNGPRGGEAVFSYRLRFGG
jgi:hypothetical protein